MKCLTILCLLIGSLCLKMNNNPMKSEKKEILIEKKVDEKSTRINEKSESKSTLTTTFSPIIRYEAASFNKGESLVDFQGNSNMTLYNMRNSSLDYSRGNFCINFDGSTQYSMSNDLAPFFKNSKSVSLFVYIKYISDGVVVDELGQPELDVVWHDSQIEIYDNGIVGYRLWNGLTVSSNFKLKKNQYYHLGFTYDETSNLLFGYVDGNKINFDFVNSIKRETPYEHQFGLYYSLGGHDSTNLGGKNIKAGMCLRSFHAYNYALKNDEVQMLWLNQKNFYDV